MNFENVKYIYFIGIGGIGMSGLARFFHARGIQASGYDKSESRLTRDLVKQGMQIQYEDDSEQIPNVFSDPDMKHECRVIYTPAVPEDLEVVQYLKDEEYSFLKRAEVLGEIAATGFNIAVAGTHGKTTISSMITHIFHQNALFVTGFLGGIAKNFGSNLVLGRENVFVTEADEYDRSFLHLRPAIALISSVDPDHLDIYDDPDSFREGFNIFATRVRPDGHLIAKKGIFDDRGLSYHLTDKDADYTLGPLEIDRGAFHFEVEYKQEYLGDFSLMYPGRHNLENALGAIAVCHTYGLTPDEIKKGLRTFLGVQRRFDIQLKHKGMVYMDDYAHHPAELKAVISSVKELYPDQRITGVFQPHLYSRTRDFMVEFAEELSQLDAVILLDIYPAREQPIEGVSSQELLNKIQCSNKRVLSKNELLKELETLSFDVLLTLGAGDIDRLVEPITEIIKSRK